MSESPTQQGPASFTVPGNMRVAPTPDEDCFLMPRRHWRRLRRRIGGLTDPISFAMNLGWTAVGVCLSGCIGLLPWMPAYAQLPPDAKLEFAWVTPALVSVAASSLVVAVVAFVLSMKSRS